MKLLLDTCTFLWTVIGNAEVPARARALIVDPGNEVFLSAASAWEIALKVALGRLRLPADPHEYVPAQRERHRIASLGIDETAALHVARLPPFHRDPFDRLLVAQALLGGLAVVTPDRLIAQYPVRVVW